MYIYTGPELVHTSDNIPGASPKGYNSRSMESKYAAYRMGFNSNAHPERFFVVPTTYVEHKISWPWRDSIRYHYVEHKISWPWWDSIRYQYYRSLWVIDPALLS